MSALSTLTACLIAASAVSPANVVVSECDARGFVLRVEAPSLGPDTSAELVNQLGIGLVARGYALCVSTEPAPANVILVDELDDGSIDVLARYHGRQSRRVLAPERRDSKAAGLTLTVAVEELVLIVTDPAQPADTVAARAPASPITSLARPWLRLGTEVSGWMYEATRVGVGLGLRLDRELADRLRVGLGVAARQFESEAVAEGRVRYRVVELQGSAHAVVTRTSAIAVAIGAALAPALVHASGEPAQGASGHDVTRGALVARAVADIELQASRHQTIALRFAVGRPLVALAARTEAGRPLGGVAEWELSLAAAWLWSLY